MQTKQLSAEIPEDMAGLRLDQALSRLFTDYSRNRLQEWLRDGQILVDNKQMRPRDKVKGGEQVSATITLETDTSMTAEDIPLDIVYEDEALLVVNKPVGLVVHPAAGNRDGTMLNALLYHDPNLAELPRAGILHRLDKQTSGLLVVARTLPALTKLSQDLQAHDFEREYQAICSGVMTAGGTVEAPVGRHPRHRTRMAVVETGKHATTHYRVIHRYRAHTHVRVMLETGRTHQIRVHMAHINYPVVGDPIYGGRAKLPKAASEEFKQALRALRRQALHATRLGIRHPLTDEAMEWTVEPPADFTALIDALAVDQKADASNQI